MLMSEGLIPAGFDWPTGRQGKRWEAGGWHCWAVRCRPPGLKGSMSLWVNGDWWVARRSPAAEFGNGYAAADLYEKHQDPERAVWRQSEDGQRMFRQYVCASEDRPFQAFKRQALGLADWEFRVGCVWPDGAKSRVPCRPGAAPFQGRT
jgi:hypothetical protein